MDTLKKYNREYRWAVRRQKIRNLKRSYRLWCMEHPVKAFCIDFVLYALLWTALIIGVIYL